MKQNKPYALMPENYLGIFFVVVTSNTESRGVYMDKHIAKPIEDELVRLS